MPTGQDRIRALTVRLLTPAGVIGILVAVYSACCFFSFFPPVKAPPFVDTSALHEPVVQDDYLVHYTEGIETAHFFKTRGRLWGYNPWFLAGYPCGVYQGCDNRWVVLCQLCLGWVNPAFAFNVSILLALLMLPWLAFGTATAFGMRGWNRACYVAISTYGVVGFKLLNAFILFGGIGFVLSVFLSFLAAGCLDLALRNKSAWTYVALGLAAASACFVHILAPFPIICAGLAVLLPRVRQLTRRDLVMLPLAGTICALPNLIWIVPFLRFQEWRGHSDDMFQTPLTLIRERFTTDTPLLVMTMLFILAIAQMLRERRVTSAISHTLGFTALFAVAFFGSQIGLGDIQPGRFIIPLMVFSGLAIADQFHPEHLRSPLAVALLAVLLVPIPYRERLEFRIGFKDPEVEELLSLIREEVPSTGRLHVQDSFGHPYFHSHFPAYIPSATGRALLAGPYGHPIEDLNYSQFVETRVFGRELNDFTSEELSKQLSLYNVSHILVYHDYARRNLKKLDCLDRVFSVGKYDVFKYLSAPLSFCQEGQAEVEADMDRITVRNARPGPLVLKFHYLKTLRAIPESVQLSPVAIGGDAMPFIRVEHGNIADFEIVNP